MIIFDEVNYAENILRNGCSKRNVLIDFKILAKYFLYYKHNSIQETKEKMLEVLKNSETFIPINYIVLKIDKAIQYAQTEQLKRIEPVSIYKEEIDFIQQLSKDVQDIAFIYLFLSKWTKDPKGFFVKESDIKKLLGITIRNKDLQIMNKTLEDSDFLKFKDTRTKELIKVLITKNDGEEIFQITDFTHPLLHYKQYLGEKIINCVDCNCLVKAKSNRQKYCKSCANRVKLSQINKSKKRKKLKDL